MLHLAGHNELRNDEPSGGTFRGGAWITPQLHELEASSLAARCRTVATKYPDGGLPYGFYYAGGLFGGDGTLQLGSEQLGLTCATFVLALFKSVGIELLDLGSWKPRRKGDQAFREGIVADLRRRGYHEHADAIQYEPECGRYRPTEVAGAAVEKARPVVFVRALELAKVIEEIVGDSPT